MSGAVAILGGTSRRIGWRESWRARRLTRSRTRERLAGSILRAVDDAGRGRQAISAAIPIQRRAVLGCRDELAALAERLRAPTPVYAQGVALVRQLLTEAGSPLYQSGGNLHAAVTEALAALDGHVG